jgi:hypothetical protein
LIEEGRMKKLPLVLSIVLNLVLIAALVGLHVVSKKTAFGAAAEAAAAEARLQEHILAELDSGDPARIEKVKVTLKRNIENGKKVEGGFRSVAR